MVRDVEHLPFHVLIDHLYIFFREMSIQILCPFLNWVICFYIVVEWLEFFMYSGNLSLISYMICKYLLLFCGVFCSLLIVSFDAQKTLIFIKFNVFVFSFVSYAFGVISMKSLSNPRHKDFLLHFLLRVLQF